MGTFEVEFAKFCLKIRLSVYEGQILKYCVLYESSLKVPYIGLWHQLIELILKDWRSCVTGVGLEAQKPPNFQCVL